MQFSRPRVQQHMAIAISVIDGVAKFCMERL